MSYTSVNLGLDTRPRKFTVTYSQLATAATSNFIQLFSLPAGAVITLVKLKHSIGFSASGQTSYTLSIGTVAPAQSPSLTKYLPAYQVDVNANPVSATTFVVNNVVGSENHTSAVPIYIAATSNVNLNLATQGSVDVWVWATTAI